MHATDLTRPFTQIIADTAAKCMPRASHIVAPGARHMWPGEEPQAFSAALAGSLEQQR